MDDFPGDFPDRFLTLVVSYTRHNAISLPRSKPFFDWNERIQVIINLYCLYVIVYIIDDQLLYNR